MLVALTTHCKGAQRLTDYYQISYGYQRYAGKIVVVTSGHIVETTSQAAASSWFSSASEAEPVRSSGC